MSLIRVYPTQNLRILVENLANHAKNADLKLSNLRSF